MSAKLTTLGPVTIATAGTRVQCSASNIYSTSVILTSDSLNSGKVYVGDSTVTSSNGQELGPGESLVLQGDPFQGTTECINLWDIYFDTSTNGNKMRVSYLVGI